MCGIVGYVGDKRAVPILLEGLQSLEYRGYDSSGLCVSSGVCVREVGKVTALKKKVPDNIYDTVGIAHTRWATHGAPTKENSHPHTDCTGDVMIVHNGIIENYSELKAGLEKKGHSFSSETDSEIIAHLIEQEYADVGDMNGAVITTLKQVRGTYGLVVLHRKYPDTLIVARMGSPIVIGITASSRIVSSDPAALVAFTRDVVYLKDGEMAILKKDQHHITTFDKKEVNREIDRIDWDTEVASKGGYEHFMLKEIMETPTVLEDSARGRFLPDEGFVKLGGLEDIRDKLKVVERIIIIGCGSAYYAGMVGQYLIEKFAHIPTEVEIGSEFRYRDLPISSKTAVLAISQSGETADTLASLRRAKDAGALTLGIVNTVGSTIARETDAGVYNHAGPEIGVASTKAFISQLEVLVLFALFLGELRGIKTVQSKDVLREMRVLPEKMSDVLAQSSRIENIAKKYRTYENFLYIGRKMSMPIAFEGALKLKEIAYVHAEGYGAGEMKHGPLAMIDETFPTVAIAPRDLVYEKTISNIEEIRARNGPVIVIATEGDDAIARIAQDTFYIPQTHEALSPILSTVPLQLFAYYAGILRGFDVDRPRNLAKSVTVE
ncbi:glutamine--fructose-6-phosphate transaminase (isomerizing) [Candidatus Kaiserbacteria bacterium CG10_big_fil_rev_8_21_14_0_10_43_70]|uniref:Glutamine--fructose-6-phosphate aminotransferase [isomerizing] n=1 Tax=Candidatus Kaiserbacteria bacterium CG10_big_fil_rev_8_21_14_0_10_43_70 TaxID=1974605 RepID=A0A2H0UJM2_9BACT|nr:MAG: glutamine--fructose-6-phosphate transaminase (isomerizing) [Candidatus Kaiserbacteria bacterium CG10_big_fil_rev_8_21_14_0_10_43_70]